MYVCGAKLDHLGPSKCCRAYLPGRDQPYAFTRIHCIVYSDLIFVKKPMQMRASETSKNLDSVFNQTKFQN